MTFYLHVLNGLLCWLTIVNLTDSDSVTLEAIPSNVVTVNQTVILQCNVEPSSPIATFQLLPLQRICELLHKNGTCKSSEICQTFYSASCQSNTRFSIQVNVPRDWNGRTVRCYTFTNSSNNVSFSVKEPVTHVTLFPKSITVMAGQQITLTCETPYSNPKANITWYKSSVDISSESNATSVTNSTNGFTKTISSLRGNFVKEDNTKQIYCIARNTPETSVTSNIVELNVTYKPEVSSNSPNPHRVKEGTTITLMCYVTTANPRTGIIWRWFEKDVDVLHNTSVYTISNIQRGSSGPYSCTAENSVGNSDPVTINVDVQYKPEVSSNVSSPYKVTEGETATLMCIVTNANPNTGIRWEWSKTVGLNPLHNDRPTYTIPNIQRGSSGQYNCTASNSIGKSEAVTVIVDVQYKPEVSSNLSSPYKVREGETVTLVCTVADANPNTSIIWKWIKTDSSNINLPNQPTYEIFNIRKENSGQYKCTASNEIGTSEAVTIEVDVQYKPSIQVQETMIVNETERVEITGKIFSNPLSNVSWYNGTDLLESGISQTTETSVTTYFVIQNARCTDTKNFTVVASNELQRNVTSRVDLRVNCKPVPDINNITLGVSDDTGFAFSTTVIAYPQPRYVLLFGNSTNNNGVWDSMTVNAVNNFTVHLNKTTVNQTDYGTYYLNIANSFGGSTIYVNVIPEREPTSPRIGKASCNVNSAKIEWTSSFNGGDSQTFFAVGHIGQHEVTRSEDIEDRGENKIHHTELLNLQPLTKYVFYVVATNKHGNSSSGQIECTTLEDEQNMMPLITGGATAGVMFLAVIVIVVVVLLRRYKTHEKQVGKSQRFDNDEGGNEDIDDDGLKENILYVSAGPRSNNESERAVYAAVTKKPLEDNANVYADVKKDGKKTKTEAATYSDVKPKKGLFKKDDKQKPKNGKKQKGKQVAADVYENSEDIAMTSNADNVYSNTNYNAKNDQEQRGYKNKDGLLYVDVQFDAKKGIQNPVIHGEDEKTDYATVEFPMPSSSQEYTSAEK